MLEKAIEKREANLKGFATYKEKMPELGELYVNSVSKTYQDGVISAKYKRLMALTGALVSGCEPCMFAQTVRAIEQGATVEEILETCAVAISLGGTMAAGQTTKIMNFLKEMGRIE